MILQQSSSSPSFSECFLPFLGAGGEVTGEMTSAGTGEYFFSWLSAIIGTRGKPFGKQELKIIANRS